MKSSEIKFNPENKSKIYFYGFALLIGIVFFIGSIYEGVFAFLLGAPFHWAFLGSVISLFGLTGIAVIAINDKDVFVDDI